MLMNTLMKNLYKAPPPQKKNKKNKKTKTKTNPKQTNKKQNKNVYIYINIEDLTLNFHAYYTCVSSGGLSCRLSSALFGYD